MLLGFLCFQKTNAQAYEISEAKFLQLGYEIGEPNRIIVSIQRGVWNHFSGGLFLKISPRSIPPGTEIGSRISFLANIHSAGFLESEKFDVTLGAELNFRDTYVRVNANYYVRDGLAINAGLGRRVWGTENSISPNTILNFGIILKGYEWAIF